MQQKAAKRRRRAALAGTGILFLALIGIAAVPVLSQTGKGSLPRIGEFTIYNEGGNYQASFPVNTIRAILTGPKLSISSKAYDMAARRIEITMRKTATTSRYNSHAVAKGNVRITVRQPEAQRTHIVTCNSATYTSATAPPVQGRIDFQGNVRWVVRDPGFAGPSVTTVKSGYIEFLPGNETRVNLSDGNVVATPIEPAARPKPRK